MKINKKDLDLKNTLLSGQCFRCNELEDGSFDIILIDRVVNIKEDNNYLIVNSSKEDGLKETIIDYFDLNRDYEIIDIELSHKDELMENIVNKCKGYKILHQSPLEMYISYIISQNNNVKRISSSIETLCKEYGNKIIFNNKEYYLFPSLDKLLSITIEDINCLKIGFRDKYIINALDKIRDNKEFLNKINELNTEDALRELMSVKGIGLKVASCILLFGYLRFDVFPIDTWVKQFMLNNYKDIKNDTESISKFAKGQFGDYSGIALQYMFHSKRNI